MAPRLGRPEVIYARQRPGHLAYDANPASGDPDGDRQSELGLHANPRCVEECGASRGLIDACEHPQGRGHSAERFVRSTKEEYLNRVLLLSERHLRRTIAEFVAPAVLRQYGPR